MKKIAFLLACAVLSAGCQSEQTKKLNDVIATIDSIPIAPAEKEAIQARVKNSPDRFLALLGQVRAAAASDPYLVARVDKERALAADYAPGDLVLLDGTGLRLSRPGHSLRKPAYEALKAMDAAARAQGVSLLVSSTYRSYAYQAQVFQRYVESDGEAAAARYSARPGHSQHQLGMAIDFGSISDDFAGTPAEIWLRERAGEFGFSLSYPEGMEPVTGYVWESWHYRYIGVEAAAMQKEFFGGIQQYLLLFIERSIPTR